jgi:hypothetical protein
VATQGGIERTFQLLCDCYRTKVSMNTFRAYTDLLSDIDDARLLAAARQHTRSSKWFPSVAQLREAAGAIKRTRPGQPLFETTEEWKAYFFGEYICHHCWQRPCVCGTDDDPNA